MILYSITINIEKTAHDHWMKWIKTYHVPTIIGTGLIIDHKILKLLTEEEENTGITYSFQYYLEDLDVLKNYQENFEPAIDEELYKRYQGQFVEFRTILEVM
jgi:hypothetical protein